MLIAALVTVAKKWEQAKYLSTDEWIVKICMHMHSEHYSFIEKRQAQKQNCCMISYIKSKKVGVTEVESRMVVTQD
jgi:hypothetical protein